MSATPQTDQEREVAAAQADALRRYYASLPEHAWQSEVEELLREGGWEFIHVRDARRQHITGFPDLFAVKGDKAIAIELKTVRGRITPEQARWLALLRAAGISTYVWRPTQIDEVRRSLLGAWSLGEAGQQRSAFTGPYYAGETSHER
jgi:hypothetical protein